jgi:hypothetical protein
MLDLAAIDWTTTIQAILFALFGGLTAILTAIIGPTYDNLLVPMLQPGALFPALSGSGGSSDFLAGAAQFSAYTLANVVDPLVALVALGVAVLFLVRSVVARWADRLDSLLPRLVVSVIVANFTLPIAGGVLDIAGALYPVLAGWDGGAWTHWVNLAGYGQVQFSWDNGALAFVLSFVEFFLVFGLLLALGVRDALVAVLLVLLPVFTLLWPLRPIAGLARRAWLLFFEVTFLPCVLVVPLELAVGSPSPVMLVGYLGAALASPYLLSLAGTHLAAFGVPGAGSAFGSGTQRGFSAGASGAASTVGPSARAVAGTGAAGRATTGVTATAGASAFPATAPLAAAELIGHTALHLLRHLPRSGETADHPWKAVRGGGAR